MLLRSVKASRLEGRGRGAGCCLIVLSYCFVSTWLSFLISGSHKRRDKRCHIAAPLLRSALHTVLAKHDIGIDETGASLAQLDGPAIEDMGEDEREMETRRRMAGIEGIGGGEGGEVGIFNINHVGGHRYAGVMLVSANAIELIQILFPSGAYLSYGRVTPQEIPRVVEDTILEGKIVPGLLRNAVGVSAGKSRGFLGW